MASGRFRVGLIMESKGHAEHQMSLTHNPAAHWTLHIKSRKVDDLEHF